MGKWAKKMTSGARRTRLSVMDNSSDASLLTFGSGGCSQDAVVTDWAPTNECTPPRNGHQVKDYCYISTCQWPGFNLQIDWSLGLSPLVRPTYSKTCWPQHHPLKKIGSRTNACTALLIGPNYGHDTRSSRLRHILVLCLRRKKGNYIATYNSLLPKNICHQVFAHLFKITHDTKWTHQP